MSANGSEPEKSERSTKEKILFAAIELFAKNGYVATTVREIADKVGITAGSIYNHFASKEEILAYIYDFFREVQGRVMPDMRQLMALAETDPPHEVLRQGNFFYPPELQKAMDSIVVIAAMRSHVDENSTRLLKECLFSLPVFITKPLIERMIELGRIEPMDVDAYIVLSSNFIYSAAIRNLSSNPITLEDWFKGSEILSSLIKPTGK